MLSFFHKFASKQLGSPEVYESADNEILLPDSVSPQTTYGSLNGAISSKLKDSSVSGAPMKILGAFAVLVLLGRAFMAFHAEQATEQDVENLRLRLQNIQEPKCEGYRKMTDTSCGGEAIVSAGHVENDLSPHPGCKAVRRPALDADLALHGIINASSMQDRAANLLDGTNSEWWTGKDSAELTLDILREAQVKQLRLQWWGMSYADEVTVSASFDGKHWRQIHHVYNYADLAEDCTKRQEQGYCSSNVQENNCRRTCFLAQQAEGASGGKLTSAAPTMNGWTDFSGWTQETRYVKIELAHGHDDPWKMHEKLGLRRIEVWGSAAWEPCAEPGQLCKCFGSARIWQASTKTWITKGSGGSVSCTASAFDIQFGRNTGGCQCWPAATEEEALEQCRGQCDALGDQCSAFEYSYITNIHEQKLGPRCCFRSQVGDTWAPASRSHTVKTSDCYRKDF